MSKQKAYLKNCAKCKMEFIPKNARIKICVQCQWTPQIKECNNCGKEFLMKGPTSNNCSRKCITSSRNKKWAVGGEAWREKWGEEADEKMKEFKKKLSERSSGENNGMHGKAHSQSAKDAIGKFHSRTDKEKYGEQKASEISRKKSERLTGEKNPAYGKVYSRGGRSVKGHYKGKFFRSLLEYSFMKYAESTCASLDDFDYENFIIPWVNEKGVNRTYRPDFFHIEAKTVYEIKQSYAVSFCELKHQFAQDYCKSRGLLFKIMTEKDFPKISFDVALLDEDVKWDERTFKYFDKSSKQ